MKFTLSITDASAAELSRILATLGATSTAIEVVQNVTHVANNGADNGDDDATDTVATPGTVDKSGLPWDDRIHSTPAKLTTKHEWRARRGVAPQLVAQVEAELRARQSQPAAPVQQPAPQYVAPVVQQPAPQYQPQPPVIEHQPAPQYQAPAPVQQQPAPQYVAPVVQQPAPVAAPQVPTTVDFNGFMQRVQSLLQQQLIDAGYLVNVAQRIGQAFQQPVSAITDIMGNQPMIDYAIQMMTAEGRWNWN